ncbi:MAG: hypothetical protein QF541_15810, partial [Lentisphaeria bacterium]|nr:hypothetical protein [Lentisphaeria bacterium]
MESILWSRGKARLTSEYPNIDAVKEKINRSTLAFFEKRDKFPVFAAGRKIHNEENKSRSRGSGPRRSAVPGRRRHRNPPAAVIGVKAGRSRRIAEPRQAWHG